VTVTISRLLGCSFGVISCLVVGQAWAAEDEDDVVVSAKPADTKPAEARPADVKDRKSVV
jgi:hypothetical protein